MRLLTTLLLLSIAGAAHAAEAIDLAPVKKWIAKQDEFNSVQADFTQTRALRALRSPVASPGRLTFVAPNSLRWELGDPPKTIVLRKGDSYTLIQPAKKKAERLSASKIGQEGGAKGFAMMEFPIAKDFADFQRKFEIIAVSTEGDRCNLELLPRDPQARKFLSALKFNFNTKTNHMNSFEIVTKEGSSMRNEFSNVRVNQKVDRRVFDFDLTGYDVTDGKK
jgi:outer membrane lipoprotein-sorting protein